MTTTTVNQQEPTLPVIRPLFEVIGKYTEENVLGTFDDIQDAVDFIKQYGLFDTYTVKKVVF